MRAIIVGFVGVVLCGSTEAGAQTPLTSTDLKAMVDTYRQNQARFKRDYVGRPFSASMPLHGVIESTMRPGTYTIGFGTSLVFSDVDCTVSDKPTISRVTDWNKGDIIRVQGTVTDYMFGAVKLDSCRLQK